MACLSRYLGLMIGDLVPDGYRPWQVYLLLRKIIGIVTALRFVDSDVFTVKQCIKYFLTLYISLYGELKPKFHFMTHIPRVMKNNGPFIHFWCMPFERWHVLLKDEAVKTHSHRHLAMTMCIKDRLELAYSK